MPDSTPRPWDASGAEGGEIAGPEVFEEWLAAMHPKLAGLQDLFLPRDFPFDYTRKSFERLEEILLATFPDRGAVFAPEHRDFLDRCVRYIGETMLRNFGGEWHYSTDPEFIAPGVPYIVNDDGSGVPVVPLHMITSLVARRTGSELTQLYDGTERLYREYRATSPTADKADRKSVGAAQADRMSDAARAFLDQWQETMEAELTRWAATYMPDGFTCDFSRESLYSVEQQLLDRVPSETDVEAPEHSAFVEGVTRYLGETLVRAGLAHWFYQDWGDDAPKSNLYHRVPYVETNVLPQEQSYVCVPLWSIEAAADQRTGEVFVEEYDNAREDIERYQKRASR